MCHQTVAHQKIRGRGRADDAEPQADEPRIVQIFDGEALVRPIDHHIGRKIIGVCSLHDLVTGDRPYDQIAAISLQRVARKPDDLRKPRIFNFYAQSRAYQFCNLVLEPLFLFICERQVVGIGADLEHAAVGNIGGRAAAGRLPQPSAATNRIASHRGRQGAIQSPIRGGRPRPTTPSARACK